MPVAVAAPQGQVTAVARRVPWSNPLGSGELSLVLVPAVLSALIKTCHLPSVMEL